MYNSFQRGAALISALFIMAVTAMLATAMAYSVQLLIHHSNLIVSSDQAYQDLLGVQDWGLAELSVNGLQPYPYPPFSKTNLDNFDISGEIDDPQGKYNINNLITSTNQTQFITLIQAVDSNISTQTATAIAQSVTNWLTGHADDTSYLQLIPPYRSAGQPMLTPEELRAVLGVNADLYQRLSPYLTALPASGMTTFPININTASAPVLMTLSSQIDSAKANALVACRRSNAWFQSVDDYNKVCVQPLGLPALGDITVTSSYYLITGRAVSRDQQVQLQSLVLVSSKNNKPFPIIVWQALN